MDWYVSGDDPVRMRALRHQISDYLSRHADSGSDVADAELVVHELLANAVEHATGPIWVRLSWVREEPDIEVWDLGPGFTLPEVRPTTNGRAQDVAATLPDLDAEGGRGLFLVTHLTPQFQVAARSGGGAHVAARLAVRRAASPSIDPAPLVTTALPDLDEADEHGAFGRESFLRALVVQMAQAIEHSAGPGTVEEVVAQVGIAVGGQMESAYRIAQQLIGRLTGEQLADCYVRLKHAIDGGFYVIDIDEGRIVLGNTRCPFGDVVRKSPALCRMTSSVFGGIAARNRDDGAAVVLEERIAVGDPGCRVVIYLGDAPEQTARFAHRYRSPVLTG
jgi:anti-sigma regulatory factor (Ser/Thr protein kinase)/predicted ArsR family transcriptional regulator